MAIRSRRPPSAVRVLAYLMTVTCALTRPPMPNRLRTRRNAGRAARRRGSADAGSYSTEWVVVTALVVATALAVTGFILLKVTAKAHSIDFG